MSNPEDGPDDGAAGDAVEEGGDSGDAADAGDAALRMPWWDALVDDMAATAGEYDEAGWETLQLHPGDVTALDGEFGDEVGLDVLVPDNEFSQLESYLSSDAAEIDGYEVYRTTTTNYVALLVVLEDRTADVAVLFPAYYARDDDVAERLFEQATEDGRLTVFLRELSESRVEVTLDDPSLLAPPEE